MSRRRQRKRRHPIRRFIIILTAAALLVCVLCQTVFVVEKKIYPLEYGAEVEKAARDYDLDEELIYAVINTESHFDADACSGAGAKGLMQLMPSTFEWLQSLRGEQYDENSLFYPDINIDYGCYLLRYLLDKFGSEETAVAAYNAGFSIVEEWLGNPEYSPDGVTLSSIPYPETEEYVKKVESAKEKYKKLYNR